jgi:hypothetical protein
MPMIPNNYPYGGATIPPTNRTYSKVVKATNDVHKTQHKAAIIAMGGVEAVASAIWAVLNANPFATIFLLMLKMQQMMWNQQKTFNQKHSDATLAIIDKMR